MADTPEVPKKEEPTALAVRNPDGSVRMAKKDSKGRFVKSGPKLIPTIEITALARKWLHTKYSDTGKITKESKTRFEEMQQCMFEIASGKSKLDPKSQQAAVCAYEALMLRAHGKPSINDEEKDALRQAGVRVVLVPAPVGLPVVNEQPREALEKPAFIDAEVVSTNPPQE